MKPTTDNLQPKTNSGFTLIELLVVIGIFSVLATLGYLVTIDFYKSYAFNAERDTIVSLLQKARAESLSNINNSGHGVYMTSSGYTVFQGATYAGRVQSYDQVIPSSPGITFSPSTFEVDFTQLSGNSNNSNSITLTDGKRSEIISLNSEGQINW